MVHFSLTRNKPPIIVADGPLYKFLFHRQILIQESHVHRDTGRRRRPEEGGRRAAEKGCSSGRGRCRPRKDVGRVKSHGRVQVQADNRHFDTRVDVKRVDGRTLDDNASKRQQQQVRGAFHCMGLGSAISS